MRLLAAAGAALAALVTACGGSPAGPGTAPASPAAGAALHGAALATFACPARATGDRRVPAADVTAVRLCPRPPVDARAVTLRADDPRWDRLLAALSAADVPPEPGQVCPAYADLEQRVVADSARGPLRVHIPVDGCRHYQRAVVGLLAAIRADPHPAPSATAAGPLCPPSTDRGDGMAAVDFVDFVHAFGQQYVAGLGSPPASGDADRLGRTVLVSRCAFSAYNDRTHRAPGPARDGDTAFLAPGTPIHAYDGWPVRCVLAAVVDGGVRVYRALRPGTDHAELRPCAVRRR